MLKVNFIKSFNNKSFKKAQFLYKIVLSLKIHRKQEIFDFVLLTIILKKSMFIIKGSSITFFKIIIY